MCRRVSTFRRSSSCWRPYGKSSPARYIWWGAWPRYFRGRWTHSPHHTIQGGLKGPTCGSGPCRLARLRHQGHHLLLSVRHFLKLCEVQQGNTHQILQDTVCKHNQDWAMQWWLLGKNASIKRSEREHHFWGHQFVANLCMETWTRPSRGVYRAHPGSCHWTVTSRLLRPCSQYWRQSNQ